MYMIKNLILVIAILVILFKLFCNSTDLCSSWFLKSWQLKFENHNLNISKIEYIYTHKVCSLRFELLIDYLVFLLAREHTKSS